MSIAHPEVLERMRREGYPWNKPWDMNFPTSQIPDLPPIPSQSPRPEGFQRAVTGLADYITGNKWDFDQRGRGGQRQWDAPDDLTVTQGAEQGVRRGGGILDRIKGFLGGLELMPNELVDDPRNPGGPQIHPDLLDNQWRDRYEKGIQQWNR